MKKTPLDLTTYPEMLGVSTSKYSHDIQRDVDFGDKATTTTYNGTQTFSSNGVPCDSDNDN